MPVVRVVLCLALALACGEQGEGERCDVNNANLDCASGLVCRSEAQLSITGRGIGLCCPLDVETATEDACRAAPELPPDEPADAAAPPPADAAVPPADAAVPPADAAVPPADAGS